MPAPANELQAAIYGLLVANSAVSALVGARIYDRVPMGGDVAPFITFGPADEVTDDAQCIEGAEHSFQIDVWSEKQTGFDECKEITWAVKKALHEIEFDLPTHALVEMRVTTQRFARDPDGITSRGIVTIEAMVESHG